MGSFAFSRYRSRRFCSAAGKSLPELASVNTQARHAQCLAWASSAGLQAGVRRLESGYHHTGSQGVSSATTVARTRDDFPIAPTVA